MLDDRVLSQIVHSISLLPGVSVLDIGCGRGFFARWLRWSHLDCRYVGVDSVPEAIAAARQNAPQGEYVYSRVENLNLNERFERIVALEAASTGTVTKGFARSLALHLAAQGRYVVTLLSLDGRHDEKIVRSIDNLERAGTSVTEVRDFTLQVKDFAATMCSAFLLGTWESQIKARMCVEAAHMLHAIERGTFNYTMLIGAQPADP